MTAASDRPGPSWLHAERERREQVVPTERWPLGEDGDTQAPTGFQGRSACPRCHGHTWEDVMAEFEDVRDAVGMGFDQRMFVVGGLKDHGPGEYRWCESCDWIFRSPGDVEVGRP